VESRWMEWNQMIIGFWFGSVRESLAGALASRSLPALQDAAHVTSRNAVIANISRRP